MTFSPQEEGTPSSEALENNSEPNSSEKTLSNSQLWDEVGFHRPLAGFWYKFGFNIIHIIGGILVAALVYPLMFPFPEIDGYYRTGTSIFAALFVAFDLGTANMMNRFIGETGINNPEKMIQYLQYFIWYQMFSGVMQVTIIAIWAIYLPPGNLIHLTWIWLIYSTTQYPAMQAVFKNALSALQQFDKASILGFLEGDVIQKLSEIVFVLGFRYTLGQNPQYHILLACAMGLVIGKYADDFLVMCIGMYYFNRTLQRHGITARVCFHHDFDWNLVKETFIFGVKTGLPGAIGSFAGLITLVWWLDVPQYSTFVALFGLAASIVNFVQNLTLDLGGAISESYLNGKKILCQYYIGQSIRFDALVQFLLYSIIFIVTLVLEPTLIGIGLSHYILSIPFILPIMIRRFINPYESLVGTVITSTNHPNIYFVFEMIALGINLFVWFLLLVVFRIPQQYGLDAIFWVMPCGDAAGSLFKVIAGFIYIQRKIVPVKIPFWQSFGGTSIAGLVFCLIGSLYYRFFFVPTLETIGLFVSLGFAIVFLVLGGAFVIYIPMTTLLGVWDNGSVDSFRKAAKMSGFARILVVPMLKMLDKTIPIARLHNRFAIDDREALEEARDLMHIKLQNS